MPRIHIYLADLFTFLNYLSFRKDSDAGGVIIVCCDGNRKLRVNELSDRGDAGIPCVVSGEACMSYMPRGFARNMHSVVDDVSEWTRH